MALTGIEDISGKSEFEKTSLFELIHPSERNYVVEVMHECITNSEEFEVTFNTSRASGKKLKMYGYPEGNVQGRKLIGVIEDISMRLESGRALLQGQDSERKRLSLEIHDSIGQKLVAIKYNLALYQISKKADDFNQINDSIDGTIEEIRTITHNLSTQIVSEVGLKNSLGQLLEESSKALKAEKIFEFSLVEEINLNDEKSKMIYRIVQECLSNAMKHSRASEITLRLRAINQQLSIEIEDNGRGFEMKDSKINGIGLSNIRERVSYLDGFIRISSQPGAGTSIKVRIPNGN